MAQQADSEAISLVIQKLTEIVEKQNLAKKHGTPVREIHATGTSYQVSPGGAVSTDHVPRYQDHGAEILIAEDSIAVVEEVVGSSPVASDTTTSPAKSEHGQENVGQEVYIQRSTSPRQVGGKEPEQVILNFPVKVGNINITNTEGLIATLQKLDSALQGGGDPTVVRSVVLGQGQGQGQGQLQGSPIQAKEIFKCAKCDYRSHNKHYLKQHVELTHNADRPFKCPFCNYAGKRSHSLKEHLIVHSNCRPYSCVYCNATFRKKGHLTNHVKMHINHDGVAERPERKVEENKAVATETTKNITYQCSSCSFVPSSIQGLHEHLASHDSTMTLQCDCEPCGKQFSDTQSLARHISANHAGETKEVKWEHAPVVVKQKEVILVCSECGYKTQDKQLLTQHMIKHIDGTSTDNTTDNTEQDSEEQAPDQLTKTEAPDSQNQGEDPTDQTKSGEDTLYRCAQCSFTTKTAVTFIQHMLSHKPQKQAKVEADSSSASTATEDSPAKVRYQNPVQKLKSAAPDPAQPFTHDQAGGVYRCSICGYTCELQRTIKSHIWKHSGHHDIDYPMFRNGPISVYDNYPIGVPVLLSEKSPVMQMKGSGPHASAVKVQSSSPSPSSSASTTSSQWSQKTDSSHQSKSKEMMLVRVQGKKPGSCGPPARNRHKTISQLLAESRQATAEPVPSPTEPQEPGTSVEKPDTMTIKHKTGIMSATSDGNSQGLAQPSLDLPIPVQYLNEEEKLSPSSPDGMVPTRIILSQSGCVYQVAGAETVREPVVLKTETERKPEPTIKQNPGTVPEHMSTMSTMTLPTGVTLPGSEILKLIMKNRLQATAANPPVVPRPDATAVEQAERTPSVKTEAGSAGAGDASSHSDTQEEVVNAAQGAKASGSGPATRSTTSLKRKHVESFDELELHRLAKKLYKPGFDHRNVVVEEVSQAYTTPSISLLDSRGASPRYHAYSPRANSPRLAVDVEAAAAPPRVMRGRSRSAEEVRKPPMEDDDEEETQEQQPTVTLLSLLKKGPNLNPACPMVPRPTSAVTDKDTDKRKQGISSSLLAVIEQLRERSRSESEPDDSISSEKTATKTPSRKRSKRGSADEEEDRDTLLQNYANIEQVGDQYRCKLCHYSNVHAALLKVHMRQHKVKRPCECSLCEFVAKSNEELQNHMLKHCKVRTYQCKLCTTSFSYKSQLRAHMRIHAEQNPYLCDHCDFQGSFTELKQHMLKHDRVYYVCDICEQTFESEDEHRAHETECREKAGPDTLLSSRQHLGKRLLQCTQCDFLTNSQAALLNHAGIHKGFEVQCELCNFTATSMRSLKSHMKRHINDQKFVRQPLEQYKCNLCGYVCHHLPSLKSHMWRHASDTNYSYQDSNDIINAAIDLDTSAQGQGHAQGQAASPEATEEEAAGTHVGYNNFIRFRCCQCGFESVDRSELNDHMQTHSDIIQKTLEVNRERIIADVTKNRQSNSEDSGTEEDANMEMKQEETVAN